MVGHPRPLTPERAAAEEAEAHQYALLLHQRHLTDTDWQAINARIITKWSVTALKRIKKRAWDLWTTNGALK
jgi:hypothetical protein